MSDIDDIIDLLNTPTHAPPPKKESRVQSFENGSYPHTLYHSSNQHFDEGEQILPWSKMSRYQRSLSGKTESLGGSHAAWAMENPQDARGWGKYTYTVSAPEDARVLGDGRVSSHSGFTVKKKVF